MAAIRNANIIVRAVGYIRTSSATNVGPDKDSEPRQMLAIKRYASAAKLTICDSDMFSDKGVGGTVPLALRSGWRKLLDHYQEECIKYIIVEDSSMFARDLVVQETGYTEMVTSGFEFDSAASPTQFLQDSAEATLVMQLFGAIAQFQRKSTTERLSGARLTSAEIERKAKLADRHGEDTRAAQSH